MSKNYSIENQDMGIDYADEGPWRSYELTAYGNSLEELLRDATVTEVDQDWSELRSYPLGDLGGSLYDRGEAMLQAVIADYDPSPYCACGAMTKADDPCGPRAEND